LLQDLEKAQRAEMERKKELAAQRHQQISDRIADANSAQR
jgi:hypothetical protein